MLLTLSSGYETTYYKFLEREPGYPNKKINKKSASFLLGLKKNLGTNIRLGLELSKYDSHSMFIATQNNDSFLLIDPKISSYSIF